MSNTRDVLLTLINMGQGNGLDVDPMNDLVLEESPVQLAPPSMYQVIMFDDDYTPMDFVVHVLEQFFLMDREKATHVMLTVHTQGKASCGLYTKDIAETKVAQVIKYARENQHPLLCEIEVA